MSFLLGCNYLETQNGTAMWKSFNEESIREDLKVLQEHGVEILRVFPNWRDFQPVIKMYGQNGRLFEYRMQDETLPLNSYYLDEAMMQKFIRFCCIAESYGMKLIVGLLTGWLSSRLFIPEALGDKNLFTDPQALILEQKFVSGFVKYTKDNPNIYGWDLGNECNNLSTAISREEAFCWSAVISNAIRAQDNTRPVISGMHGLEPEGIWRISDQAETTDILTTHPYPLWVEHCTNDAVSSVRTLLHATAQTVYYASIGGKPCLVEEIGTMGPMVCSDEIAAGFLKANLFSNWANGAPGLLWWCSSDQNLLSHAPYDWAM
ncbi:MAG: glycoside hydrolase 5 family protein, partial [Oscillospiraceae bacterium]